MFSGHVVRLDSVAPRIMLPSMPLFRSRLPLVTVEPCLPVPAKAPPTGPDWVHEIKHDGFRVIARRDGKKVRLTSRQGKDLTYRLPLAVQAIAELPVNSCIIDGEAIVSDPTGLAVFSLVRSFRNGPRATLCAFDLIKIDGEDLRWRSLEDRKGLLKRLSGNRHPGIAFNKHFDIEGSVLFHHACKLGCEGIVSKRLGSPYRFGRSNDWIKVKNPAAPAVKREAEEDWRTMGKRVR
jgi:bifunctional non-homologous end joining protein LigD